MRRSTPPFAKAERSSALAAPRDFQTSWCGQPTTSTCVYTALSAGTDTIIPRRNSFIGQRGSRQAAQQEPGFISTTILQPTRHETRRPYGACWHVLPLGAPGGRRGALPVLEQMTGAQDLCISTFEKRSGVASAGSRRIEPKHRCNSRPLPNRAGRQEVTSQSRYGRSVRS
jgi:hypothetical protein